MSAFVLKSVGIQLTDIWSECQKEMIEMRDKILVLNDCLKTWEVIGRHLTECNETLVVLVEKTRTNDKKTNKEIIVLINDIKEHENCIEREKENLNSFKTLSEKNRFNDKRVLQLIEEWNQTEKGLSEEKSQYLSSKTRNRQEFNDNCCAEVEEVFSDKETDIVVNEVKVEEVIEFENNLNENNSKICVNNDYYSDEDFECLSAKFSNSESDYSDEEVVNNKHIKRQKTKPKERQTINETISEKRNTKYCVKDISDRLSNNECVTEIGKNDDSIKRIYTKTLESDNREKCLIGFGCNWNSCKYISNRIYRVLNHINDKHLVNNENVSKSNSNNKKSDNYVTNLLAQNKVSVTESQSITTSEKCFENNERPKTPEVSYNTLNEEKVSDLEAMDVQIGEDNREVNGTEINDNNTDKDLISTTEDLVVNDSEDNIMKTSKSSAIVCPTMTTHEISEKLSNNECVTEMDDKNESILRIYLKTNDSNNKRIRIGFRCTFNECQFISNRLDKVMRHLSAVHFKNKPFKCDECQFRTNRRYDLTNHMFNKHRDKRDELVELDKPVQKAPVVKLPKQSKQLRTTSPSVKTITVNKLREMMALNKTMESLAEDNCDIKVYRLVTESPTQFSPIVGYGCKWIDCPFLSLKKYKVIEHIQGVHQNYKPFECDFKDCNYKSSNKYMVFRHKLVVHNTNSRDKQRALHACDWPECHFKSYQPSKLKEHKVRHSGNKPYKCDWPSCEFETYTKGGLNRHIDMHRDYRPHPCHWPGCELQFRTKGKLRNHLIIHGEERPYKCDWPQCGKTFKSDGCRWQHQVIHTGNKRFACSWPGCQSKFRDNGGLQQHLMIHSDERPVTCADSECDKRFRHKSQMAIHFRLKHRNKLHLLTKL